MRVVAWPRFPCQSLRCTSGPDIGSQVLLLARLKQRGTTSWGHTTWARTPYTRRGPAVRRLFTFKVLLKGLVGSRQAYAKETQLILWLGSVLQLVALARPSVGAGFALPSRPLAGFVRQRRDSFARSRLQTRFRREYEGQKVELRLDTDSRWQLLSSLHESSCSHVVDNNTFLMHIDRILHIHSS